MWADQDSLAVTVAMVLSGERYIGKLTGQERAAVVRTAVAKGWPRARIAKALRFSSNETLATWCRRHKVHLPVDPPEPHHWCFHWLRQHNEGKAGQRAFKEDLGTRV